MTFRPTIGLEIHAELKTRTKMFCACFNDSDEERPNVNICPVCMAHPGTLPVINKEAVRKILLMGVAVGGRCADRTVFDRKNYFYPDIPKGYQISQYLDPLVSGGSIAGVELTRIHLEEDTARSQHLPAPSPARQAGEGNKSLVDFNRAGVPLMELVTEPVVHSAEEAVCFARELRLLLRALGAGDANMEKGEMRVEANISIAPEGSTELGTKVEVKNLNSFRSVERAIRFEIERHTKALEAGKAVVQETRGWDDAKQATFSQRKKERAHDYRYFPEPDLPELRISEMPELSESALRAELPELPWEKRERYVSLGVSKEYAEMFVEDAALGGLFDAAVKNNDAIRMLAANYLGSDIAGLVSKYGRDGLSHIEPAGFAATMDMVRTGELSSRGAKDAIAAVFRDGGELAVVARAYLQQSDHGALENIAKKIMDAHPSVVADYRAGKTAAMQFLVGQGMKETKGSANPAILREAFEKLL